MVLRSDSHSTLVAALWGTSHRSIGTLSCTASRRTLSSSFDMLYRTHAGEELDCMLDFIPNVLVLDRSAERAEREIAMYGYGVVVIWVGCGNTFPARLDNVWRVQGRHILPNL